MTRVLVVDDEKGMRTTLRQFLEKEGHVVETAEDAEKAFQILDEKEFDVVLADIIMPKISGVELLESIQKASPELKVILITGEPTVETAAKAVREGAFDYLVKPVTREEIWKVVGHAAIVKELEDENRRYRDHLEELILDRTEQLQKNVKKLSKAIRGVIKAMAKTIEMRDPYTAGHQRRVTRLALAIAREMELPKQQIEGLHMAALIHDLGKITIPAEILNKTGHIGKIAYELIKTHPQVGYDILKSIDFPWPVAEIVHQHQERLDGSGYPQGLRGDEILLEARILAVADVVEAVASHRPYRPALGSEYALKEIASNKGRLFDPEVVDACTSILRSEAFSFNVDEESSDVH
ncbi:HD domain-containing phosphohydrolase [Acidobacteriota bacterium]